MMRAAAALVFAASLAAATPALAYRPFGSTDAGVADRGQFQGEFGLVEASLRGSHLDAMGGSARLNYGLTSRVEAVLEGLLVRTFDDDDRVELLGPALAVKALLWSPEKSEAERAATLIGFTAEAVLLLPATPEEERHHVGFEAIGIVSGTLGGFTWHLNAGGGLSREQDPLFLWGAILERPLGDSGLRLVAELNGEKAEGEPTAERGLLGAIYQPADWIAFDAAAFRSLGSEPEWGVTAGFTIAIGP